MSAPAILESPALRLPGQHFVVALVFLALGSAGLVWIAPELAAGLYLSPHVTGVTHCFTLGWLTTTIFGALYQLLPVALGARIRSKSLGYVSLWCYAPGVALFATGVAAQSLMLRDAGIVLVTVGILCLIINVAYSLRVATKRDEVWAAIAIALFFLSSTLALGMVLARNLHTGFLAAARVRVLGVHLHVAMIGWVLIMIVGISHRLLPMFLLAHSASMRLTRCAIGLLAAGVLTLVAGVLCGLAELPAATSTAIAWTGLAMIEGGILCYLLQVRRVFVARMRPKLDAGLLHVPVSLSFLAASALLGPFVLYGGVALPRLDIAYVTLGLLGGLTLFAIGQFYKIVPFLIWIARYRHEMGRKRVPALSELYSSNAAHHGLVAFTVAVAALVAGEAFGSTLVLRAAACLFSLGVLLFAGQMVRVAFGSAKHASGAAGDVNAETTETRAAVAR